MTLNVANCPKCGRLMMKGPRALCPHCLQEIEDQYNRCLQYLRENKSCTLVELSEATRVPVSQITKFIREGRISIADHPSISYECEVCGTPIREGHLCDACRQRLVRDMNAGKEDEQVRARNALEERTAYLKDRK